MGGGTSGFAQVDLQPRLGREEGKVLRREEFDDGHPQCRADHVIHNNRGCGEEAGSSESPAAEMHTRVNAWM
jgi:hypothetical protein